MIKLSAQGQITRAKNSSRYNISAGVR